MSQYLPTGDFKFLSSWELNDILRTASDADQGFFVEVDLHYPQELHDKFNDFPPAPIMSKPSDPSSFQQGIIREKLRSAHPKWSPEKISKHKTNEKLIASLEDKKNYVCHYRLLQKYVELGMQVIFTLYFCTFSVLVS